jgi:hypothetical protein
VPTFSRIANVEFVVHGADQRVTVSNLPYSWNPAQTRDMDAPAAFDAITFLCETGMTRGLSVISVCSSPVGAVV